MIDIKPLVVEALQGTGLNVYYELFTDSSAPIPCITYRETNNADRLTGDTLNYSDITFHIKLWARSVAETATYAALIDNALKPLGFTRTFADELVVDDVIQKILRYAAVGYQK